jgi:hypothetical protein
MTYLEQYQPALVAEILDLAAEASHPQTCTPEHPCSDRCAGGYFIQGLRPEQY